LQQVSLSPEQLALFEYIENEDTNIFVTGRAGTGKSTLLTHLVENTKKKVAVAGSTGVAAYNVGGQTIHSLLGVPPGLLGNQELKHHLGQRSREVLRAIDMLVIDEISMVNADLMDAIEAMLSLARGKTKGPFGGVQIVMFGDPYQLAPVPPQDPAERAYLDEKYRSHWFFDAHCWDKAPLERYELHENFRQSDPEFIEILNAIRDGSCTQDMLDTLNAMGNKWPKDPETIRLATTNAAVNKVNAQRLAAIPGMPATIPADVPIGEIKQFGKNPPGDPSLVLKVGAQVMFIKNDDQNTKKNDGPMVRRWVNGTLGKVVSIKNQDHIVVDVDGEEFEVGRSTWEKIRYELSEEFDEITQRFKESIVPVTMAEFRQVPLRLAWAVTIHKSQGLTYDEIVVDMGNNAFSPGQTYVALSRVKSPAGLHLTRRIQMTDVIVDPDVVRFMTEGRGPSFDKLV
jgi:ATP-dependent exoDNAse (exonuclease V) alpha subunit